MRCSNTPRYEQGGGDFTSSGPYHPLCNRPYRSVLIDIYKMRAGPFLFFGGPVLVYFFVTKLTHGGLYESGSFKAGLVSGKRTKASSSGDKPTGILVNYGPKTHFSLIYPLRVVKQYIK